MTTGFPTPFATESVESVPPYAESPLSNVSEIRLRRAFEKAYRVESDKTRPVSFERGGRGSYVNDRLEARYQGFKLAVEGVVSERVSLFDLTSVSPGIYDRE